MKIEFTQGQYKELLKLALIGAAVKVSVLGARGEPHDSIHMIEDYLLDHVETFELDELIEDRGEQRMPAEKLTLEIERMLEEYDEDTFWFELETELAERDYLETLGKAERAALEKSGMPPIGIHAFRERYVKEFEKHGTDRLRIIE